MKSNQTPVIFRTFTKDGDVIALFPFIASDPHGHHCLSYQRVGQHSGATPDLMNGKLTRPSSQAEIDPLKAELLSIGYILKEMKRFPRNAFDVRRAQALKEVA